MLRKIRQIEMLVQVRKQRMDESSRILESARLELEQETERLQQLQDYQRDYETINTLPTLQSANELQDSLSLVSQLSNASRFMSQLEGAKQLQAERLQHHKARYQEARDRWSKHYQSHLALTKHLSTLRAERQAILAKEDDRLSLDDWLASR